MAAMRSLGLPLLLPAYSTQTAGAVDAGPARSHARARGPGPSKTFTAVFYG